MIKDIEMFMELDSEYEEMKIVADTYAEFGDLAYGKAAECLKDDNLVAYGVWMDLVEVCNWYLEELNKDIDVIREKLQELVGEA